MSSSFKPDENVLVYHDSTFFTLGMEFDPSAEYAGCRLCGEVYQSDLDRQVRLAIHHGLLRLKVDPISNESYFVGAEVYIKLYHDAHDRRHRWREVHARRYHTTTEIENFNKTGFALTPEAAHKLAPKGFAPVGNLHPDIVAAMGEAPRAPLEDSQS